MGWLSIDIVDIQIFVSETPQPLDRNLPRRLDHDLSLHFGRTSGPSAPGAITQLRDSASTKSRKLFCRTVHCAIDKIERGALWGG